MEKNIKSELWDIAWCIQDIADGGWRKEHPPLPVEKVIYSEHSVTASDNGEEVSSRNSAHDISEGTVSVDIITSDILECKKCRLASGRIQAVPGIAIKGLPVLVVGEAPGADEDRMGEPFVGKAGKYLDKWLAAIGLERKKDVNILNVVKCRPPNNRDPLPDEIEACIPYLKAQISLLKPVVILTLGRFATSVLTGSEEGITKIRGKIYKYDGIPLVPTFHPSAVLRNQTLKRPVWEDLKLLKMILNKQLKG
ncbi:uracil-DNA glycosylase [Spirochaetia bacterium 38H-sp]|uniref:Type-4 uracil-DNA glycosylase n=1 Tax=Rarispira pelagica TaxID=3141764 RepID=A0ABU9UDN4_9SPIR